MNKQNRAKYLMKNTIIFAIGNFGTKIISFFLVPLYTSVLSTSEYGTIDLVNTMKTILVPILSLNIGESIMRFMLNKNTDKDKIINIGFLMATLGTIFGLIVIPIASVIPMMASYGIYIYLSIITMMYSNIFLCVLRGQEKLLLYSIGNIVNTFAVAVLNIVFLLVFNAGIKGYFTAYIIASGITAIYAFIVSKSYKSIPKYTFDKKLFSNMVKYSVVLIPTSLMWWIINSSDRVMITAMIDASANGIYSISYKLPTLISVVASIFNQAWTYSAIHEEKSRDRNEYTNNVYIGLSTCVIIVAAILMAFMKIFLRFYVDASYYEAWRYTPYLIIGVVFSTLGTFLATPYTVHLNSKGYLVSATVGALVNIVLNTVLIPICGISGAALATCVSYISVFVYRAIDTRKYVRINIMPVKNIISYLVLVGMGVTMYIDNMYGQILLIIELLMIILINLKYLNDIVKMLFKKLNIKILK